MRHRTQRVASAARKAGVGGCADGACGCASVAPNYECKSSRAYGSADVAPGGTATIQIEPSESEWFEPQRVRFIVRDATALAVAGAVSVEEITINGLDQECFSSDTGPGLISDFFDDDECCEGVPVCWSYFSDAQRKKPLEITVTNPAATGNALRVQVVVSGRCLQCPPPRWKCGHAPGLEPQKPTMNAA